MYSVSRNPKCMPSAGVIALLVHVQCVRSTTSALSVTPSTDWYGDDGTWSAISIRVGTSQTFVDIFVGTVTSETWVVGSGGCAANDTLCETSRGELFDPKTSSTWHSAGLYQFGVDSQLGNTGYGDYGLDTLTFGSTRVSVHNAAISLFNSTQPINETSYLLGLFGLGIVPGSFDGSSPPSSVLGALVEQQNAIPSRSYGYTAGAKYQQKGVPNSLTLGGYDANRFVPHNTAFNLSPSKKPETFISSLSVTSTGSSSSSSVVLLNPADRVSAIIDSSTPYLWFPKTVCDRFADTLGLTYNSSLKLYTFHDAYEAQHEVLVNGRFSFTFSLSDTSSTTDLVNITLPYTAFDLQLTYPAIPGSTYGATDATKYYFPLRQATNEAQYTIGRVFLQEAYLITDYERNEFSIHQAVHIADPIGNASVVAISRFSDSRFAGPKNDKSALSRGAIAGIAIGVLLLLAIPNFAFWFIWLKRRRTQAESNRNTATETKPRSFLFSLLGLDLEAPVHEVSGSTSCPMEVGADASHECFELPTTTGPTELDAASARLTVYSLSGTTENETQDSACLSAYERAGRRMERQQIAAAHARIVLGSYPNEASPEKGARDVSDVPHHRGQEFPIATIINDSPLVSPTGPHDTLTVGGGQPSPVSPDFLPGSNSLTLGTPPPSYRRHDLDPSCVAYVGRLPENVQLPKVVPRALERDERNFPAEMLQSGEGSRLYHRANESLGSQFTETDTRERALRVGTELYGTGDSNGVSPDISSGSGESGSGDLYPVSGLARRGRDIEAMEMVHVPQISERRFSWEEERI